MSRITRSLAFTIAFLALSACGGGGTGPSSENDGNVPLPSAPPPDESLPPPSTPPPDESLPPPSAPPPGESPAANSAPWITGAPARVVTVGKPYEFAPRASDADGDALRFSVSNLPPWAQFDASTGRLSGTPGHRDIGHYSSITISVSDGKLSATLPEFAISVENAKAGSATLRWAPPTRNKDGSKLTDLAGFRVYYSQDSTNLASHVEIPGAHIKSATIEQLTQGTWYFAVTAYTTAGIESSMSMVVSKTIG